jgi:molecular chaperone IbpA
MTNNQLMTRYDFTPFNRATIGFDRLFDDLDRVTSNTAINNSYPPYNIEKISDNEFVISVAVAGFTMDDLEITHDGNELTIVGTTPASNEDKTFLHKGIATRGFTRVFTVADHVEVESAELELGLLNIYMKRNIPEELQPKRIAITSK